MSRKRKDYRREIRPDARYADELVSRFVNAMMWDGKKSVALSSFYGAMDFIKDRYEQDGLEVFRQAMENVRPVVEVRSRRVGGATYQVPTEVRPARRDALALRWIIGHARQRSEKSMRLRLANELYDASQNRGNAVKKKEDTHRMAEANRAFAHYRW